jgi:putative endonuclease
MTKMQKEHKYFVYILASQRNGTLYIGVTNGLLKRNLQHKWKEKSDSFTAIYDVNKLVYYETYQWIQDAINREKQLKGWNRLWRLRLIEKENPEWRDLFVDMM